MFETSSPSNTQWQRLFVGFEEKFFIEIPEFTREAIDALVRHRITAEHFKHGMILLILDEGKVCGLLCFQLIKMPSKEKRKILSEKYPEDFGEREWGRIFLFRF